MVSLYGCGSIDSWQVEPLQGSGLLFPTKIPETHFIDLGRMKG